MSAKEVTGSTTSVDAISADVWPDIVQALSSADVSNLAACNKAFWQVSCHKHTLQLALPANKHLQRRLVSLLNYLTSRRGHLQVCLQQQPLRTKFSRAVCWAG